MKTILLALTLLIICSCKKSEATSTVGDEVIGTYSGSYSGQPATVQVYKISNQKYGIRKVSPAPFPEFTMQYKLNFLGVFDYDVAAQGNITTDSSSASYFEAQHRFGFTIKENNGTKWDYDGFK